MKVVSVYEYTDRIRRDINSIDEIPSEDITTRSLGQLTDLARYFLIVAARKNKERYCKRKVEDDEVAGFAEVTINSTFRRVIEECKRRDMLIKEFYKK